MRLTKIKLAGFKSFVDSTTISFPGNLMGIVGPNGCGKSNIIDAIRWVLGESSAKTLRGDSMADVIFNGSSVRKPVGRASVELIFNNSDSTLGGPFAGYSEVSVRRVVSRDGTSRYFLNNSRCRRKDITHMLLGTGLGAQGYSIIEQGMISRLVEARPEELRAFLEEAAGISKYKERRRETEHRIRRTRENLERLSDLREEVGKQLDHLQRQARAAERYKALRSEQRRMAAELLALRLSALRDDCRMRGVAREKEQTGLDAVLAKLRETEASIEQLRIDLDERNDQLGDIHGRSYKVDGEISRLEQSLEHRGKLGQRRRAELQDIDRQIAEIESHIDSDRRRIQEIDRQLDELGPGLKQAREDHEDALDTLRKAEQAWEESQERWGHVIESLADAERTEQVEAERLEHLHARQQRLCDEQEQLVDERSGLSTRGLRERLGHLAGEEERTRTACEDDAVTLRQLAEQVQSVRETEFEISGRLDRARRHLHEQRGRMTSLEALRDAAAAPGSDEAGTWLKSRNLSSTPRFADALAVEAGWEAAVETVLGNYLQAVCVDDIDEAAASLSDLTAVDLTLWGHSGSEEPALRNARRMLSRYVRGPGVERLLAAVYAAESVADAVAIRSRLKPDESVVTRDGIWMGSQWLRVKRGADPQAGVLARAEELKRVRKAVAAGMREVRELERVSVETRNKLEQLESSRAHVQADAASRQQLYADTRSELDAGRSRLDELATRDRSIRERAEDIAAELGGVSERALESGRALGDARTRREQLARSRAEMETSREDHRHRLAIARSGEEQERAELQKISLRTESQRSARESAVSTLHRVREQQEHLRRRRAELQAEAQAAVEPMAIDERALEAQLKEKMAVEERLRVARRAVEDVESRLSDANFLHAEHQQQVETARDALAEARVHVGKVEVRIEAVTEEISKTGFDADGLLASLADDASVPDWEEELEKLDRRIRRLGSINLAAIDEFACQSERKQYLDAQFTDLSKALDTLEKAIRKIDRETRTRFDTTFKAANAGLGRLFPRLYGGGHAFLELEGDDLLSSGVTVMARPPGKRVSTIHLLSGGEKALTAVALVFSIFELNPAPFCLLDEVDAPLDDANVGRFAEIVKEMSQRVQFVLITHNKATMESMQQLTGVTMSEPGVSRLVAVDIDEAVQLAAV